MWLSEVMTFPGSSSSPWVSQPGRSPKDGPSHMQPPHPHPVCALDPGVSWLSASTSEQWAQGYVDLRLRGHILYRDVLLEQGPLLRGGMQPWSPDPVTRAGTVFRSLPVTGYQVQITVCTTLSSGWVTVASVVLSVSIGQGQKAT